MRNTDEHENPKSQLTRSQKIGIAIAVLLIFGNIAGLVLNVCTANKNQQLKKSIDEANLQAAYAEDCQIISDYITDLTPPLVRYQDEFGREHLYYCYQITVDGPEPIEKFKNEYWLIHKTGGGTEHYDLPDYDEILGQTIYHTYDEYNNYSHTSTPKLETYSIYEANGFYHEIEGHYNQVSKDVNIDDPDAVATFLAERNFPTATIYGIEILKPTPDQTVAVSYDAANNIPSDPPKESTCCGCTGCCCENCACTG